MPNLRLTRRAVDDIPFAASGQVLYRDTMLTGFGLRVGSRSKVYFVEGQVSGQTRRATIGRADLFAPEVARKKALAILGEMAEGRSPADEKRKGKVERVTLFAEKEVLLHLGHLGSASAVFAGRSDFLGWSQVGEKRSIKALLHPHRMHFPSLIV